MGPRAFAAACAIGTLSACGSAGARAEAAAPPVERILGARPRLLWVAAHPDDESMAGSLLARACVLERAPCHFLVLNRGRGGECGLPGGCAPDLGAVRHAELARAARLYRATLEHYDFFNAPLPVESFPTRREIERRWRTEGDPAGLVARAIRRFRPTVVVTLSPYRGFTGHPEHQAAARFAIAGARLAADATFDAEIVRGEAPHRIDRVLHVQNEHWFMRLAGDPPDPKPSTWAIDNTVRCEIDRDGDARRCIDVAAASTRAHRSQDGDMSAIRAASRFWTRTYVRRLDPFGAEAAGLAAEALR